MVKKKPAKKKNNFFDKKKIHNFGCVFDVDIGYFAKIRKNKHYGDMQPTLFGFYSCREEFAKIFRKNSKYILFSHTAGRGEFIADFIRRVEEKIGIAQFSKCGPTQRRTVMWIKVSPWWCEYAMRRSFLTVILRAGEVYNPITDNFITTLNSNFYLNGTKKATKLFLKGYTVYTGKSGGWYNIFRQFDGVCKKDLKKLLVRP